MLPQVMQYLAVAEFEVPHFGQAVDDNRSTYLSKSVLGLVGDNVLRSCMGNWSLIAVVLADLGMGLKTVGV